MTTDKMVTVLIKKTFASENSGQICWGPSIEIRILLMTTTTGTRKSSRRRKARLTFSCLIGKKE